MRLEEYMEEFGCSFIHMAKKTGLSQLTIRNIAEQKKDPLLSTALTIESATKGQVTCRELLPKKRLEQMLKAPFLKKDRDDSQKSLKAKNKKKEQHDKKKP